MTTSEPTLMEDAPALMVQVPSEEVPVIPRSHDEPPPHQQNQLAFSERR